MISECLKMLFLLDIANFSDDHKKYENTFCKCYIFRYICPLYTKNKGQVSDPALLVAQDKKYRKAAKFQLNPIGVSS
jgi:hypothetical protein